MYSVLRKSLNNNDSEILGDFNLPHIDWATLSGTEIESHRMIEFLEENYLSQMVSEPTRQNNILDLVITKAKRILQLTVVITTQDNLVSNVTVGEHFGSCDHKLVRIDINPR